MCGIAGQFLNSRPAEARAIRAMCAQIRHRGPDDEGVYTSGRCGIGMRRLSIIDLSTGHQPISNEDGSVWVVFNGEIYNFQDLRRSLIRQGHQFQTNSDTETVVHLYEEEGVAGLGQLRGMFACAIWDERRHALLLVRDRFGKKPLYYAQTGDGLYFGSELKCLRAAGVPLDIDEQALRLYFQFRYIPDPWTPYKQVKKLPPGSWMLFHANGRVESGRYWAPPMPASEPPAGMTEEAACDTVRNVFDEAVRMRLIADVPLGAFLSGGIDSSSVVASMALQSAEPVKTFSIGFEEADFNELPWAAMVARKYGTDHHEIVLKPDSVSLITKVVDFYDEPFGDDSSIPTYLVSEFAAQHVKVVLTGDGGDEIFAGYESFFSIDRLKSYDRIPSAARRALAWTADRLPYSAYGKNFLRTLTRPTALERYVELNHAPYFQRAQMLRPEWMLPASGEFFRDTFQHCLPEDCDDLMATALYFEATAKLTGDMLVKVDRMSMANSLEVRCPLLDHVLAETAAALPHRWKVRNGRGKDIFIRAVQDRLPAELLNRPKKGFGVPLRHWFRGPLRPMVRDLLTSRRFVERGMCEPRFIEYLINEHESGRRDNYHALYVLLMLELWFRSAEQKVDATAAVPV